jgi:phage shock protein C
MDTTTKEHPMPATLDRPQHNKMVAGVCAGLAERFGWDANTVRVLFAVSCLLPGPQFLVYVALWVIMPKRRYAPRY